MLTWHYRVWISRLKEERTKGRHVTRTFLSVCTLVPLKKRPQHSGVNLQVGLYKHTFNSNHSTVCRGRREQCGGALLSFKGRWLCLTTSMRRLLSLCRFASAALHFWSGPTFIRSSCLHINPSDSKNHRGCDELSREMMALVASTYIHIACSRACTNPMFQLAFGESVSLLARAFACMHPSVVHDFFILLLGDASRSWSQIQNINLHTRRAT